MSASEAEGSSGCADGSWRTRPSTRRRSKRCGSGTSGRGTLGAGMLGSTWLLRIEAAGCGQCRRSTTTPRTRSRRRTSTRSCRSRRGAEFTYRLLIATTDHLGPTARRTLDGQEKPVGILLRSDLETLDLPWPQSLAALRPAKLKPKRPRPHQRQAVRGHRQRAGDERARPGRHGVRHR